MSKILKICLKLQILYYQPLTKWLLGTTIGNQEQPMMEFPSFDAILHSKSINISQTLKSLLLSTNWVVVRSYQGKTMMSI